MLDFANSFYSLGWTLLAFIVVLSVIVFVHEMGHYIAGRLCHVRVSKFSVGFGKELFGFTDKAGTRWAVSLIPLGGYVMFYGDANAASVSSSQQLAETMSDDDFKHTLPGRPLWQRAIVAFAGPLSNFVLTLILFTAITLTYGERITEPVIGNVIADSPAAAAGLLKGDRIVSISGKEINRFRDIIIAVSANQDSPLDFKIARGNEVINKTITPACTVITDAKGKKSAAYVIGVGTSLNDSDVRINHYGIAGAVGASFERFWFITTGTLSYLGNLVTGNVNVSQLGGPIKIAELSGQAAGLGFVPFLNIIAVLSLSIGILNLLPIPMLDGGHLLLYLVESIYGKPLNPSLEKIAYGIGFVIVISIISFVIINDILQLYAASSGNLC